MFRLRSFCQYQTRLLHIGRDLSSDPTTQSEGERCLDLRPGLPVVALVHGPLGGVGDRHNQGLVLLFLGGKRCP